MERIELPRMCMAHLAHAHVIVDYHTDTPPPPNPVALRELRAQAAADKNLMRRRHFLFDMGPTTMSREEVIARRVYIEDLRARLDND